MQQHTIKVCRVEFRKNLRQKAISTIACDLDIQFKLIPYGRHLAHFEKVIQKFEDVVGDLIFVINDVLAGAESNVGWVLEV
jgi:hypothetical protein